MRKNYIQECDQIKQNCEYTAEAHHIIAARNKALSTKLQIAPAVVAAITGTLVAGQVVPLWVGWLTTISAVISAVASVLDPNRAYHEHLNAAKNFTTLKNDARALYETYGRSMNDDQFFREVKILHDRYSDLVRFAPPTDKRSFAEARQNIQSGIHKKD